MNRRHGLTRGRRTIARLSDRRLGQLGERARVVDQAWERDAGRCVAHDLITGTVRCGGPLEIHERIPRSAWPGGELCLDNVMVICRNHHHWVGDQPDAAHRLGLHGFSWERNADE